MQATSLGLSYIEIVLRIVLSLVIGGVIGLERGSKSQPAGIRTHSIVCLAACLIMMTNEYVSYKFVRRLYQVLVFLGLEQYLLQIKRK